MFQSCVKRTQNMMLMITLWNLLLKESKVEGLLQKRKTLCEINFNDSSALKNLQKFNEGNDF